MAKSKKPEVKDEPERTVIVANPPRPNKLLLGFSIALWCAFLVAMVVLAMNS